MAHEFLSDDWFAAVTALPVPEPAPSADQLSLNVLVTRDGGASIEAHLAGGRMEQGLEEGASTTITVPYEVAKSLFVKQDQQAGMQAFMSGQIKVDGDMTRLMAMGQQAPTPEQKAYTAKVIELTVI
jgi:hypothetical protein